MSDESKVEEQKSELKSSVAFQDRLSRRAQHKVNQFKEAIAKDIESRAKEFGLDSFNIDGISFTWNRGSAPMYDGYDRRPFLGMNDKHRKMLEDKMEEIVLREFEQALENFAWAVGEGR